MEVTLSPAQESELREAAARTQRSEAQIIADALQAYFEHDQWFTQTVLEAQRSVDPATLLDHADVGRMLKARRCK